jgi:hypothetical protein
VPGRQVGLGERQDDPALDDLLGLVQPLELIPQAGRDHVRPELGEDGRDRALGRRNLALEVEHLSRRAVAVTLERALSLLVVAEQRRHLPGAALPQPELEVVEQSHGELAAAGVVGRDRDAIHPAQGRGQAPDGGSDDLAVSFGDERQPRCGAHQLDRLVHGQPVRTDGHASRAVPQLEDRAQIARLVETDRHRHPTNIEAAPRGAQT